MSLEPRELRSFIQNVRSVESAMGSSEILKSSRVSEDVRRCFVAKRDIQKGERISISMLDFKRPGNAGISCSERHLMLKKTAKIDITKDTFLQWKMLN